MKFEKLDESKFDVLSADSMEKLVGGSDPITLFGRTWQFTEVKTRKNKMKNRLRSDDKPRYNEQPG